MRTMRQIIDIANEWLASKGYSQLSAGEVIFVVVETTKALKVFKIYKQDADILEKLIHIYMLARLFVNLEILMFQRL
jgi:hypothetical protein